MEAFPSRFLTFLETREQRLLAWGFYDVSFTLEEIADLIKREGDTDLQMQWSDLVEHGWDLKDFIDEMSTANLMFPVDGDHKRYRTRFAETVRLTSQLRQLFREDQWATGPNLVSDIKLHLKPRRYPKRDQPASECWSSMEEKASNPSFQQQLFEKLSENYPGQRFSFSSFQKRSFAHLLGKYGSSGVSGSVICASTGAGKTKAVYVPAILGAATELDKKPFTKIIAIYPRNVLLADQFRECLSEVLKLNQALIQKGLRPFRLGALLGNTPYKNWFEKTEKNGTRTLVEKYGGWRKRDNGDFVVPYLRSPKDADAELVWRKADRLAGRTCLYRDDGVSEYPDVPDEMLALTREQLMDSPPDILFLSVEMLNRELGNPKWAKAFGIREKNLSPRVLLLDEVHSYEGIQGAQVAWVLRRWRHATRSNSLHVVGLSATLKQASEHLSRVAAIKTSEVVEFRPQDTELEEESVEYNIVVKGDPASGTSLLSTSIQCGMLLARTLTPANFIPSASDLGIQPNRLFTKKLFGFTDNLDVVNRWLSDMSDAERKRLARFRLNPQKQFPPPDPLPADDEITKRQALGQIWDISSKLGYDLNSPLRVGRCSSQDPGLAANDDIVIATSSLEVGFDDPQVGAVMQHKRPMSIASFVQRKGRAGRTRGSRPWTMVVLSDYGADRIAFQQAERLFEPELDELNLPYQNQFVLRIQATYFLIDWIGRRIGADAPFDYLRRPSNSYSLVERAQARALDILDDFLKQGVEWHSFREEAIKLFGGSMSGPGNRLTVGQVDSIFWELPRPLLRQVVPCLMRKLERQWSHAEPAMREVIENDGLSYPLPEFLPSATFAELDVTETRITFKTNSNRSKEDEFLDVSQVLNESCPGRASKRFSTRAGDPGFWHDYSINLGAGSNSVSAKTLFPNSLDIGTFDGVRVFQPEAVAVEHCPNDVLDSSYGSWNWKSSFIPFGGGYELPIFTFDPWKDIVVSTHAFLHRDQSGIDVTRFADSCDFEIRHQKGDSAIGKCELSNTNSDGADAKEGVGFHRRVDGIRVKLNPNHLNTVPELPKSLMARFRSDYFLHTLKTSDELPQDISSFLREWIWQTSLAMLTATALEHECTLKEAQTKLDGKRLAAADKVLAVIFQIRDRDNREEDARLVENIRRVWQDTNHVEVIKRLESSLWNNLEDAFSGWVKDRYVATIAHAFRVASTSTDLSINEEDLFVDVIKSGDETFIYLSEKQSGGLGVIENIVQRLSTDPNHFHNGMKYVLSHCKRDSTTGYLRSVVREAQTNDRISQAFSLIRSTKGFGGQERSRATLQQALSGSGFAVNRERFVSLMTNVLKPGSTPKTDSAIHDINDQWHNAENQLQVGIDSRVYAYSALRDAEFNKRVTSHFQHLNGNAQPMPVQLYNATERFLLPVCPDSCQECLSGFNRYNSFGIPSRELANLWLGFNHTVIQIDDPDEDWKSALHQQLIDAGLATIKFSSEHAKQIQKQLNELFASEVEIGVLFYPVSIQRIEKDGTNWVITLQLRDLVHG